MLDTADDFFREALESCKQGSADSIFGVQRAAIYAAKGGSVSSLATLLDKVKNEYLLTAGANVNAQGGECGNALQAEAPSGGRKTVGWLLAAGADVNATGGKYGTALQAAELSCNRPSVECKREIVECLLAAGADVNAVGDRVMLDAGTQPSEND